MDNHSSLLLFPSVRFQTPDGKTIEFHNSIGSNAPPKVGDEVTVIYDPERPEEAMVAPRSMWRVDPKALLVVGAIFVGAMIVWASLA